MAQCTCSIMGGTNDFGDGDVLKKRVHDNLVDPWGGWIECGECGDFVGKGEYYRAEWYRWDNGVETAFITCEHCMSIRDTYFCGWFFGRVLDDLNSAIFDSPDTYTDSRIRELTPKARNLVLSTIEGAWSYYGQD